MSNVARVSLVLTVISSLAIGLTAVVPAATQYVRLRRKLREEKNR